MSHKDMAAAFVPRMLCLWDQGTLTLRSTQWLRGSGPVAIATYQFLGSFWSVPPGDKCYLVPHCSLLGFSGGSPDKGLEGTRWVNLLLSYPAALPI